MHAVILAAGVGTPIVGRTRGRTGGLLDLGGWAILDYQIASLTRVGIREIAIVTGYEKEQVVEHVAHRHLDMGANIRFIDNPDYRVTNNIHSLGLARRWVGSHSFLCMTADVLFHPEILARAIKSPHDISVVVDRELRGNQTKVIVRDERVVALGKRISPFQAGGTFAKIAVCSRRGAKMLFRTIRAMVIAGMSDRFFSDAIMRLGGEGMFIGYTTTRQLPWADLAGARDGAAAVREVCPSLPRPAIRDDMAAVIQGTSPIPPAPALAAPPTV